MADAKITALTELAATPDTADILPIVDDPAGTPATKKITVANLMASKADVDQIMYIGTTAHAINRASAAEGLAGITSLTPGVNFTLSQNSVNVLTSEEAGAIVNTLYLKAGNVGIGTTEPLVPLHVAGSLPQLAAAVSANDYLTFWDQASSGPAIHWKGSVVNALRFGASTDMAIGTGFSEVMRITASNVGIGTTTPSSKLDVTTTALGVTQTTTSGLALVNTTAAAAGAQQISPAIRWSGLGWKTDATAASQAVDFRSYVVPVQGAAAPTGYLSFGSSVNGGAYSDGQMVLTSAGNLGIGTTGPTQKLNVSGNILVQDGGALVTISRTGTNYGAILANNSTGNNFGLAEIANGKFAMGYWSAYSAVPTGALNSQLTLDTNTGNVGIGTTTPTNLLSLGGNAARIFWMERHTTANTAGNTLTITAGGATAAATDKAGGALILQGGLSTGSAESGVTIQGCVAGVSGTADRTQTTMIQVLGNKIGFYGQAATAQQTGVAVTAAGIHAALVSLGLITS